MALDVKKEAKKVADAIKKDPTLVMSLLNDPVKTIEKITGLDLPDDEINKVIALVKEQTKNIDANDIAALLGGASGAKKTTAKTSAKKTTSKKDEGIDMEDIQKGVEIISKLMKK